jgi:O-antigen ligase
MLMHLLVPLVAALVPLLITPGLLSYFDVTPKIAILLFGATLIFLYPKENVSNLRAFYATQFGRWFTLLLAAQWLVSAVATVLSSNPALSLNGGNWRRFGLTSETGLLLFILVSAAWLAADAGNVRKLLRAATISGALAAVYGILQYFGWDPLLPATAYQVGEGQYTIVRPPGTLGHADYFAAWLAIVVFFGLTLHRIEASRPWKSIAVAASTLASVALVLSGTRSALLGLCIGALALVILDRPRVRLKTLSAALVGGVLFAGFYLSPAGAKLRARVFWSFDDARGGARLLLWRDSLHMAATKPLTGFGPETFAKDFARFESIDLARAYPDFYHESPHNIFLDAFTGQGIAGLIVLVALCGLGCWAGLRSTKPWAKPILAALVATIVCQQFIVFIVPTALYFWFVLALLVASTIEPKPVAVSGAWRWLWLVLVLSLWLPVFAARLLAADHELSIAQHKIESGDAKGASEAYAKSLHWRPPGSGADLDYSRSMAQLAGASPNFGVRLLAQQQAIEVGVRATSTAEDRHNAWYNLATLLASSNDPTGVERSLRNAIAWAPNWFKPHWTLAQLLELTGRQAEALREAQAAVERNGGHNPEVTETLRRLQAAQSARP